MNSMGHSGHAMHAPHLDLMPVNADGIAPMAVEVAVRDGDWFDPGTWSTGSVPGPGAIVQIPAGITVDYEGGSDTPHFMVRVDGTLNFSAPDGMQTKMVVDTIITSDNSVLTVNAAAPSDGDIDIVFQEAIPGAHGSHYSWGESGDGVLGRHSWDPEQLSLGLVASGAVRVDGKEVTEGVELPYGAGSGSIEILLPGDTQGWEAGDRIVVGGSTYRGRDGNGDFISEDEVRYVTGVREEGDVVVVTLDWPLQHDHWGRADPQTGDAMNTYVANLSRNVTFSSAVADDVIVRRPASYDGPTWDGSHQTHERGHVMFMHNDDVVVRNAGFNGLGRTDKTQEIDDFQTGGIHNNRLINDVGEVGVFEPGIDLEIETAPEDIVNQRGRYAIHIHQANVDHDHGDGSHPCPITGDDVCACHEFDGAVIEGSVVWGSPGWGIVQHSSHALLKDNVVYEVNGAAIVSESGDETGRWEGNMTFNTYGKDADLEYEDSADFNEDAGSEGIGYYLKSRALEVVDNVAVSSARAGFFYHNNGVGLQKTDRDALGDAGDVGHGLSHVNTEDVPIRVFEGNEVIAAENGLRIATDPLDAVRKFNDAWSHMKDFTAWEIDEAGVSITYSSKYVFEDFVLLGTRNKVTEAGQQMSSGFFLKASVADIAVIDSHVEHFYRGVLAWSQIGNRQEYRRGYWDPKMPLDYDQVPDYEGLGTIWTIDNPAYNLWNITTVGLTAANLDKGPVSFAGMNVETDPGVTEKLSSGVRHKVPSDYFTPDLRVDLIDDSANGGLVALWREDIARHPDQALMLEQHIPLAYQESLYLSQYWDQNNNQIKRDNYLDYEKGINNDIWSGTVLELIKYDGLGKQVFVYSDFSPLTEQSNPREVSTNERLVFSKEMIDGVLRTEGFVRVGGIPNVKFVIMKMPFTDRLTGEIHTKKFLIALDLAWEIPPEAQDRGLPYISDDTIVAPEYRLFHNGVLLNDHPAIVLGDVPQRILDTGASYVTGIFATDRSDVLTLGSGVDYLSLGKGDDQVYGFGSADSLSGDDGNDRLFGGSGDDLLDGGEGDDLLSGEASHDHLEGRGGNDRMEGGLGSDLVYGHSGEDELLGANGHDKLYGGADNDLVIGGIGSDTMDGGSGDDYLSGGAGFDDMRGGTGADALFGGGADDILFGGDGIDILDGGTGKDRIFGGNGDDLAFGGGGDDEIWGEAGNDRLDGDAGADLIVGGDGADSIDGGGSHDLIFGGLMADTIDGGTGNDNLSGDEGDDRIFGGGGNDEIWGESGNDDLSGGTGDDVIAGSIGNDTLNGDGGNDALFGGTLADLLSGGTGNDFVSGDGGADTVFGGGGNDELSGGFDADSLYGEAGIDSLFGENGEDRLDGGSGEDWLFGGEQSDWLVGGSGNDHLTGDGGADKFVFGMGAADDVITDFEDGVDAIEFLIQSFGFQDLSIIDSGNDTVVSYKAHSIRLVDVDSSQITEDDFTFSDPNPI